MEDLGRLHLYALDSDRPLISQVPEGFSKVSSDSLVVPNMAQELDEW